MRATRLILLALLSLGAGLGAATAQQRTAIDQIDFGTDGGAWTFDGECDDPRFAGPGSADLTVIIDLMKDASDCRTLYEAGEIWLLNESPIPPKPRPTQPTASVDSSGIAFGDDSSPWANDGECDDRRFVGTGMAVRLTYDSVGKDATDCQTLFQQGQIRLWDANAARAATQCEAIDFGNDSAPYAQNGTCDDWRFEGIGTDSIMDMMDIRNDATDCRAACAAGRVFLRDY